MKTQSGVEKSTMATIDEFLQEVRLINWFEHSKKAVDEYYVIHSIFEAYDDWNEQMLSTWEPHICSLENIAVKKLGDEQIDKVFSIKRYILGVHRKNTKYAGLFQHITCNL